MLPSAKILGFVLIVPLVCLSVLFLRNDVPKEREPRPYYIVKDLYSENIEHHVNEQLNTTEPCAVCNTSKPTTKAPRQIATTKRTIPATCDGTCKMHIQFCGYFAPNLPQGTYCCTKTGCSVKFTYSQRFYVPKGSDAVILHHSGGWNLQSLSRSRSKNQVFIFMTREAGSKIRHKSVLYNMSMTHRFDSDFRVPYGAYNDTPPENPDDFVKDWTKGKTKLAAWMASNCKLTSWPRSEFVHNLSKLIPIDMFGKCGGKECKNGDECRKILRNYKFYFALENQHCRDYITEKFWYNALCNDVVPIVFGAARSEYEKVAPPHSFIHLDDFSSMEQFLDYIKLLDNNPGLYNSYFDWKKHGTVRRITLREEYTKSLICDISTTLKVKKDSDEAYNFRMREDFWVDSCQLNVIPWSKNKSLT